MKRTLLISAIGIGTLTSCYNRIGDLTMISNRNVDKSQDYVLLKRDVHEKIKTKKKDALERVVDRATGSVPGGEYLMNVTVSVSLSGKKTKIKGDVWGIKPEE